MKRAGVETASAELYTMMSKALVKADGRVAPAVQAVLQEIVDDADLIKVALTHYAEAVARDMRGRANGGQNDGVLPSKGVNNHFNSPRVPSPLSDGGIHLSVDNHHEFPAPVRTPSPGLRLHRDSDTLDARTAQAGSPAHVRPPVTPMVQGPQIASTARIAARLASARSVLDTLTVRDGRAIGDVQWSELRDMEGANRREALLLSKVRGHVRNASGAERVRDVLSASALERLVAETDAELKEQADA